MTDRPLVRSERPNDCRAHQTVADSSDRAHRVSEGLRRLANVCYQ
jgi:hypothetical protein